MATAKHPQSTAGTGEPLRRPRRAVTALLALMLATAACSTAPDPPPRHPPLVGSTSTPDGRGYPSGTSGSSPGRELSVAATSPDYAFTPEDPVLLGSGDPENGPFESRRYLQSLRGLQGQAIEFERQGSCCHFETPNSDFGSGLLDVYALWWEGLQEPLILYINMYDPGEALVPVGLTAAGPDPTGGP